eukprot:256522_1
MDESSLLILSMQKLKKKCKTLKISSEGSKRDMVGRIIQKYNATFNIANEGRIPELVFNDKFTEQFSAFDSVIFHVLFKWFKANRPMQIGDNNLIFTSNFIQTISKFIFYTNDYNNFIQNVFKLSDANKEQKIKGIQYEYIGDTKTSIDSCIIEFTLQIYFNKKNECFYKYYRSDWSEINGTESLQYEGSGIWNIMDFEKISVTIKQKGGKKNKIDGFVQEVFHLDELEKIFDEKNKTSRLQFAGESVIGKYLYY